VIRCVQLLIQFVAGFSNRLKEVAHASRGVGRPVDVMLKHKNAKQRITIHDKMTVESLLRHIRTTWHTTSLLSLDVEDPESKMVMLHVDTNTFLTAQKKTMAEYGITGGGTEFQAAPGGHRGVLRRSADLEIQ